MIDFWADLTSSCQSRKVHQTTPAWLQLVG